MVGQCDLVHTGCLHAQNMSENMHNLSTYAAGYHEICQTVWSRAYRLPAFAKYVGEYVQSQHVCCWYPQDLLDSVILRIQAACMREICWKICPISEHMLLVTTRFVDRCDLVHIGCLYAQNISENMHEIGWTVWCRTYRLPACVKYVGQYVQSCTCRLPVSARHVGQCDLAHSCHLLSARYVESCRYRQPVFMRFYIWDHTLSQHHAVPTHSASFSVQTSCHHFIHYLPSHQFWFCTAEDSIVWQKKGNF